MASEKQCDSSRPFKFIYSPITSEGRHTIRRKGFFD
jgi:hypothetical protein